MLPLSDASLLQTGAFINGQWRTDAGAAPVIVRNPSTGDEIAQVAGADKATTIEAIEAAAAAQGPWASTPAKERAAIIRRWFDLCVEHADDLAIILTAEQGKPLAEAKGEILYGAAFFEWFAEEGKRVYGETIPSPDRNRRMAVMKQPIGVCAAITPWNFPMAMIPRKAAPALAAGCTMVLKPASATPLSALALAELARRAGVPAGVFQVLAGSASVIGTELSTHPIIRKLTFTGSTEVGSLLMANAAPTIKKLSLELGGNAPVLVFDDADLEVAVAGAIATKFRNMGQTCVCANRIYVQSGIYDAFVAALAKAVSALKVGDGMLADTDQGPLIDEAAVDKVLEHIEDAVAQGATIEAGGAKHALGGTFFEPTVLAGTTATMKIAREETFGPVAPVFRFEDESEALAAANGTEYGLAAYVFTRDNARVHRVTEALEFGIVGVNTGNFSFEGAPFGGWKLSGVGREGSHHGIDEFLETKYVCTAI
ncbi:MAG: succinate-semialdehyde dehydrogenase/glutarate-semialdehyde dehydrogenase [Glaciecola sp.]|jgi:succinate-semialdehyde dehydrogenase/glutarate-semialdehyde dehydrogenase